MVPLTQIVRRRLIFGVAFSEVPPQAVCTNTLSVSICRIGGSGLQGATVAPSSRQAAAVAALYVLVLRGRSCPHWRCRRPLAKKIPASFYVQWCRLRRTIRHHPQERGLLLVRHHRKA